MDIFERLLLELHSSYGDSRKVDSIIHKISHYFKENQNDSTTDLLIFLTFGKNGLTSFIKKALSSEVHRSNISEIFRLLEFLLVNYEKYCIPYAEGIKELCLDIVICDNPFKIKGNALKLFKCTFAPSFATKLDLIGIMSTIIHYRDDLPPSVRAELFSVMGIIFEKMPERTEYHNDILNYFIRKIKLDRRSSMRTVSGCLDGINGYLVNFAPNREQILDIYMCLKKFCSLKPTNGSIENRIRSVAERSALKIVNRHYRVFADYIHKEIEFWLNALNYWMESSKQERHLSFEGFVSVYRSVAHIFNNMMPGAPPKDLEIIVNKLMWKKYNIDVGSRIGLVELISTGRLSREKASEVLQAITKGFSTSDNSMFSALHVECISRYLAESYEANTDYLIQIQGMAVALIDGYPTTEKNFKRSSLQALEKSFYYLKRTGTREFNEYVQEVVYQGLIRSCSRQIYALSEMHKEVTGKDLVSYKSFLPLWIYITNLGSSNTDVEYSYSKNIIATKVLDEYISSFLKINKKLDLRFHVENSYISNAEMTAKAFRPKDWQIFINNVNLFVDIMKEVDDLDRMKTWLMRIMSETIYSTYRAPLISDYYKIMIACLKIADKIHFFDESTVDERIIQKFLWNICLNVGQYKGDTQISCFQTLLAAPVRLVEPFLKDLVPIFKLILQVSSGNFSLLRECVITFERWFRCSPKEEMEFLLKNILPYFEVFLQSKSDTQSQVSQDSGSKWKLMKVSGQKGNYHPRMTDSQFLDVQKKFLLFLGTLNMDISKCLIEKKDGDDEDDEDEENVWVKCLTYDIPLSDRNLRIRLEFLPRVIELALSSGDRCTRIRACEFLHSIVSLTLGNMKKMNGELNGLFRKLVSLCLLLACDCDVKIHQIYDLLVTQMVHYFSGRERNISEKEIFIDCLMKSISHPYNSALRDLGAKLIREFVVWSLKSVTFCSDISNNVQLLLKSMYSLSIHPNHNNRRVAAIVFNNIYSLIKDETDLLYTNWFLFYYYFMEGLSMCNFYDDTSHIANAIELIKTFLRGKKLNTYPKVPPEFNNNYLNTIVTWIYSRCSHLNPRIRKLSMSTIEDLSMGLVKDFIRTHISEIHTMKEYKTVDQDEGDHSSWLNYCSSVFDYYNWLLVHDVVEEKDLKNAGIEELFFLFIHKLTINVNISDATTSVESLNILNMLEFLVAYINRGVILYNEKILELLNICIYRPSKCNFEVCDIEKREKLDLILKILIPKLIPVLQGKEIKCLLSATKYYSSVEHLRERLQNREPLWDMVEMLHGLKMLHSLQLWDFVGVGRDISGNEIFNSVFNSIFVTEPGRCSTFLIEVRDKVFLSDFLAFGIEIGVSLDVVMNGLRNREKVIEKETLNQTMKSEYFMNMFKNEVFDYFIRNSETILDDMVFYFPYSVLITIQNTLNHCNRCNSSLSDKKKLTSAVCRMWPKFQKLPYSTRTLLLSVLRSMCQLIPEILVEEHSIRNWFFNIVASANSSEVEIIFELFSYVSPINEDFNERLTQALDEIFKNLGFFLYETQNPHLKIVVAYKGLLNSFTRTRSLSILDGIIKILKRYTTLLKKNDIERLAANMCQTSVHALPYEHWKRILSFLYRGIFYEDYTSTEVFECFLLKLLQKSDPEFVWDYLLEILNDLLRILNGENLVSKISALKIIETCVVKAKREDFENVSDEKNEEFQNCISICSNIPLIIESEVQRYYVCSCFNALCTIISVKSNDPSLYKSLLFAEDFPFLPLMIPDKKNWILRMDFDELPIRRRVLIALRKSITKERQIKLGKTISSVHYLKRDILFDSSVTEDVTRFDYSTLMIRPLDFLPRTDTSEQYLELEMDEMNKHKCMPTLVGIIRHMVDEGVTPSNPEVLPFWLRSMMKRMTLLDCPTNEKIFLLKLLCNIDEYIKPYAKFIVPDILRTLMELCREYQINYLFIDVIYMIFNWKLNWNVLNRHLRPIFTHLVVHIVDSSDHYRKDIIKSNVEVLKLIIETCKDNLNLSLLSRYAFERLKTDTESSREDRIYLDFQFCDILLANSIPAWTVNQEEDYIRMVLVYFRSQKHRRFAAEICGLCLRYFKIYGCRDLVMLTEMISEKISLIESNGTINVLPLIYGVYKNYPEFCSLFVLTIRNVALTLRGQYKIHSLEMILTHLKTVNFRSSRMFGSTVYRFLLDTLSSHDFEALSITLQIVELYLDHAADSEMNEVFEKALSFGDNRISCIRKSVYNIAAKLFGKWIELYSNKFTENVKKLCKVVLINGMNDKESDLSELCLEFWYSKIVQTKSTTQFAKILCELYTPETEKGFINFAAKLMIRSAVNGPDYGKCIFEHPLVFNSTFKKKIIPTTAYYSTITPTLSFTLSCSLNKNSLLEQENEDVITGEDTSSGESKWKKRFLKDSEEPRKNFAKKKTAFEEEIERTKSASDNDVNLLREYKDGDYPFIQITHFDLLKPLEELTMKDPQIGRYFLTSLYDGFAENITDEVKEMIIKMEELVTHVFGENSSSDPAVIAFMFHILMHCGWHIKADTQTISKAAKSSGWLSVGGLLIEDVIISKELNPPAIRRKGYTEEEKAWFNMADLAHCLKEFEVLRGILVDKLSVGVNTSEAIRYESVSDWLNAATSYKSALRQGKSLLNDLFADAYLNCLARLSDWSELKTHIHDTYEMNDLWSEPSLFEKVLPWYMKSATIQCENTDTMVEMISEIQQDPEREKDLKKFFIEELTVCNFLSGKSEWAEYYLHQMCLDFLSTWSHWNKWSNNLRFSKLSEFQLIAEVDQYLKVLKEKTNMKVSSVMDIWSRNCPKESDDLMYWDLKLTLRNHFLSKIKSYCSDLDFLKIKTSVLNSEFDLVKSGIAQRNVKISEKYLNAIKGDLEIYPDYKLQLMHEYYSSSLVLLKEELYEKDENIKFVRIMDASFRLRKQMSNMMETYYDGCDVIFYECNMRLSKVTHLLQSFGEDALNYAVSELHISRSEIEQDIKDKELHYLQSAKQAIENSDEKLLSEAYVQIAKYHMRTEGYNRQLAISLFRSMNLGNVEARHLFCSLLNEVRLAKDWVSDEEIRSCFETVPVWMFLKWMNQLLANLDSEMFPFVKDVLSRLADEYPNSMRYAFDLSRNNYKYNHIYGDACRRFVDVMAEKLLSNTHYSNLLIALSFVVPPDIILKNGMSKIYSEIKSSCPDWDKVARMVQDLYQTLYGEDFQCFRGPAFDCTTVIKHDFELLLSLGRERLLWQEKLQNIIKSIPKCKLHDTLKQYSPWLYNFQATNLNVMIELPGQYSGDQKPILKNHVLISSFNHRVLAMNSKRKPIKITILGDNAREYRFLVKFGEDLRQDQRIQQVFSHMNYVLRGNQQTSSHFIDTYKVIPLKPNLGIIEWVNKTVSLYDILATSNPSIRNAADIVQKKHLEFLAQDKNVINVVAAYSNGFKNISRDTAVARFTERIYSFQWDLLKKSFWNLSTCPEQFIYLRKNFASSEAVIFIAHWLIGIGDRHLDNTLVSSTTGRALGIDFGCAFGFATEFLTPPELIPFRLTPQIINLMKPLGVSGLIKEVMINCLKAFCREKSILLATLEVFATEPALDWLEKVRRDDTITDISEWSPRKKIAMVKEKLEGANPIKIFSDDLKSGHSRSDCLEKYLEVLRGDGSRSCELQLTSEKQVECLLDLATDYHVLSKTYVGWNPWL